MRACTTPPRECARGSLCTTSYVAANRRSPHVRRALLELRLFAADAHSQGSGKALSSTSACSLLTFVAEGTARR